MLGKCDVDDECGRLCIDVLKSDAFDGTVVTIGDESVKSAAA
jgi:hypothetical protein